MNVVFSHYENIAAGIKTLWFMPEKKVRYEAGQFTELYLPHDNPDDRGIRRWFTVSSSPTEKLIGITTKFAAQNGSSYKNVLSSLKPGAQLKLADPLGDFVLPKDKTIPLVFVAGGMGITPVRSMVKYLADSNQSRDIQLIYSVSSPQELAFEQLIRDSGIKFTPRIQAARLSAEALLKLLQKPHESQIYISGPEPMVEALNDGLKAIGIDQRRLLTDFFPGYR